MLSEEEILLYKESNNIAHLTLNRPNAQNSLSTDLLTSLYKKLLIIEKKNNIKVVIISANGKNLWVKKFLIVVTQNQ